MSLLKSADRRRGRRTRDSTGQGGHADRSVSNHVAWSRRRLQQSPGRHVSSTVMKGERRSQGGSRTDFDVSLAVPIALIGWFNKGVREVAVSQCRPNVIGARAYLVSCMYHALYNGITTSHTSFAAAVVARLAIHVLDRLILFRLPFLSLHILVVRKHIPARHQERCDSSIPSRKLHRYLLPPCVKFGL